MQFEKEHDKAAWYIFWSNIIKELQKNFVMLGNSFPVSVPCKQEPPNNL